MSNVPSYPKNPLLLHPDGGGTESVVPQSPPASSKRAEPSSSYTPAESTAKTEVATRESATPSSRLRFIVEEKPVAAVLLAAGVGLLAGVFARRLMQS
jgi:hypothetical protein